MNAADGAKYVFAMGRDVTGPNGIGGGRNPTGGEFTEKITGTMMQRVKFLTLGGGGGAGMFSVLEWIVKGAVWSVLLLFVFLGYFRSKGVMRG